MNAAMAARGTSPATITRASLAATAPASSPAAPDSRSARPLTDGRPAMATVYQPRRPTAPHAIERGDQPRIRRRPRLDGAPGSARVHAVAHQQHRGNIAVGTQLLAQP